MLVFYGTLEWEGYFEWNGDGNECSLYLVAF